MPRNVDIRVEVLVARKTPQKQMKRTRHSPDDDGDDSSGVRESTKYLKSDADDEDSAESAPAPVRARL